MWSVTAKQHKGFLCSASPSLLWNTLRAADLGTEELSVHRMPSPAWWEHSAFVFLILEGEKDPPRPRLLIEGLCYLPTTKERGNCYKCWWAFSANLKEKENTQLCHAEVCFPSLEVIFSRELREEEGRKRGKRKSQEFSWVKVKSIISETKKTLVIAWNKCFSNAVTTRAKHWGWFSVSS